MPDKMYDIYLLPDRVRDVCTYRHKLFANVKRTFHLDWVWILLRDLFLAGRLLNGRQSDFGIMDLVQNIPLMLRLLKVPQKTCRSCVGMLLNGTSGSSALWWLRFHATEGFQPKRYRRSDVAAAAASSQATCRHFIIYERRSGDMKIHGVFVPQPPQTVGK